MSLYAAIDLHSSNSILAVMDGDGKALLQCRRPNDLSRLLADIAPFHAELAGVAVESTYNWYWLVDGLMDQGYAVHLVNTADIPQYEVRTPINSEDARTMGFLAPGTPKPRGTLVRGFLDPRAGGRKLPAGAHDFGHSPPTKAAA